MELEWGHWEMAPRLDCGSVGLYASYYFASEAPLMKFAYIHMGGLTRTSRTRLTAAHFSLPARILASIHETGRVNRAHGGQLQHSTN